MHRLKFIMVVGLLLTFSITTYAQSVKWGYIDTEELMAQLPEAQQAELKVEAAMEKLESKFQSDIELYERLLTELQRSEDQNDTKQIELMELEQKIINSERDLDRQSESLRRQFYAPIYAMIEGFVADVAKEQKLEYVLDAAQQKILYANESANILELVLAKINRK